MGFCESHQALPIPRQFNDGLVTRLRPGVFGFSVLTADQLLLFNIEPRLMLLTRVHILASDDVDLPCHSAVPNRRTNE